MNHEGSAHDSKAHVPADEAGGHSKHLPSANAPLAVHGRTVHGPGLEIKVAYTFLLNRFQLSRLNGWVNEDGAVFIVYTRRSLAEEMQVSYRKIIEAMKEPTAAGLIWGKRCGRGDANQIYLALVEHPDTRNGSAPFVTPDHEAAGGEPEAEPEEPAPQEEVRSAESASLEPAVSQDGTSMSVSEVPKQHFKKCETGSSRSAGMALPEVLELHPNYKDKRKKEKSHTESSQSVSSRTSSEELERPQKPVTHSLGEQAQLAQILENCDLWIFDEETAKVFSNAIERLFYSDSFRIGKAVLPQANVRSRLWDLDGTILQEAEGKLRQNQQNIRNSTAYTMAVIFNTICESHSDVLVDPYLNGFGAGT